jgi:hypothetical protein
MTNKIVLRSVEEFQSDYTPIYNPIMGAFITPKAQRYAREVGKLDFRRVLTVGDIRAKHLTPKDTEMAQVNVMEGKKTFKKYFLANQFVRSDLQDAQGVDEVTAQVLDEHFKQMDELFLFGEGTSGNDVINNGLFYSGDPNYVLESSATVSGTDRLYDLHSKIMTTARKADEVAGRKILVVYGATLMPYYDSLFPDVAKPFKQALGETLGANWSVLALPGAVTPAGTLGWIAANLDQTKLHYTELPQLLSRGQNEEKMHIWSNFMLGSCMLEVLAQQGVIHQPATLA